MQILIVSALGVAVVLISILWLRLHPFLGLIMGSMLILLLTPQDIFLETELKADANSVIAYEPSSNTLELEKPIKVGSYRVWGEDTRLSKSDTVQIETVSKQTRQARVVSGDSSKIVVGARLVSEDAIQDANRSRFASVAQRLSAGLASTFQKIGLPIAMAAIIGTCLLESGAAKRLVKTLTECFGPKRIAPTLTASGFLLGVPVFFDTVFYLLLPLAKAMGKQNSQNYVMAVMAIIVGATMAHSLVPPTPGPLLVASELDIPIGIMMLGGIIVGGTAATVGFLYGAWCSRWIRLENHEMSASTQSSQSSRDIVAEEKSSNAIPFWMAVLPLAIPIACLGGVEIWKASTKLGSDGPWMELLSDPGFVLFVTAMLSMVILRRVVSSKSSVPMITQSVADAGTILMLTCAGGAFGAALKQLQIATAVTELFPSAMTPYGLLLTAFALTALIRAAQGSATVAMITTVGIVAPLMQAQTLPFHPVYVALAIGCGSKPFPWMNDSGFWQVSTMTGFTTRQTLQTFSTALTIMGFVGFIVTLCGAWFLPFSG